MASVEKVALRSSNGEELEINEEVAMESNNIKHMIEDDHADKPIPLPNVSDKIRAKVPEYIKKHVERVHEEQDAGFVKVDQAMLSESNVMGRSSHEDGKFSLEHMPKGEGYAVNTKDGTIDAPLLHRVCYWPISRVIIYALPPVFMLLLPLVSARVTSSTIPGAPIAHTETVYNSTIPPYN